MIVGHMVPVGTGYQYYRSLELKKNIPLDELLAAEGKSGEGGAAAAAGTKAETA